MTTRITDISQLAAAAEVAGNHARMRARPNKASGYPDSD